MSADRVPSRFRPTPLGPSARGPAVAYGIETGIGAAGSMLYCRMPECDAATARWISAGSTAFALTAAALQGMADAMGEAVRCDRCGTVLALRTH